MTATNLVTAKCEAIFPYNIFMDEKVPNILSYESEEIEKAIIYSPELIDNKKSQDIYYRSKLYTDVTLDIDKKPAELSLDHFFIRHCFSVLSSFLIEVWLSTKTTEIDPLLRPIFLKLMYYDSNDAPFTNPETGKSDFEALRQRGVVLTKDGWEKIANNLLSGKRWGLAALLLLNARCMQDANRYEIAILLSAMACEYKVKHICDLLAKKKKIPVKLWNTVKLDLKPRFTEYRKLMASLGITSMKASSDPNIKSLPRRLDDLFQHRNHVAHRGLIQGYKGKVFTSKQIFSLTTKDIETAEQFVGWLDAQQKAVN